MEKQNKAPLIYGYAVCLVAVITFIICIAALVNAIIDMGDPFYAERDPMNAPSLASFENYKMDMLKKGEGDTSFSPDDGTMLKMYESAREDKIRAVRHRTSRTLIVNAILLVICSVLFITHWRWMRKLRTS